MQKAFNEVVLQEFGDPADEIYCIPVGGPNVLNVVEDGTLIITSEELKSIFDPTIREILSITREKIKSVEKGGLQVLV